MKLEYIYNKCVEFYNGSSICPPSKDLISKILPQLFDVHPTKIQECGKTHVAYKRLSMRYNDSSDIELPEYCELLLLRDGEFQITCPIPTIINGEQQYCVAHFRQNETKIKVKHCEFKIANSFPCNQLWDYTFHAKNQTL